MDLKYEAIDFNGVPAVTLSSGGQHVGTIKGTVAPTEDEFEQRNNTITIMRDGKVNAIIWGVTKTTPSLPA